MTITTRRRTAATLALGAFGAASIALAVGAGAAGAEPNAPTELTPLDKLATVCEEVNWVGDSTSILAIAEGTGTVTPGTDLAEQPLPAALFATGVKKINYDISGGRSAHERVNGNQNAVEALAGLVAANPDADCSVYSGGTNDSANIEVGSAVGVKERLDALTEAAGKTPLYVTTAAIDPDAQVTGYTAAAPAPWNEYLATQWKPELVINHAGHLLPGHFEQDGIHYTLDGTKARADLAARVLAGDKDVLFVREGQERPDAGEAKQTVEPEAPAAPAEEAETTAPAPATTEAQPAEEVTEEPEVDEGISVYDY